MTNKTQKLSIIDRVIIGLPAFLIPITMNYLDGTYARSSAYKQMQEATPVVRDIDNDGLEDIVFQDKTGKSVEVFVNKDNKYISLKEYIESQEKNTQNKYKKYLK